jgi:hypothetical protein
MSHKQRPVPRTVIELARTERGWQASISAPAPRSASAGSAHSSSSAWEPKGVYSLDRESREEAIGEAVKDGRVHFLATEPIDELLRVTETLPNSEWAIGDAVLTDPDRFRIEIR